MTTQAEQTISKSDEYMNALSAMLPMLFCDAYGQSQLTIANTKRALVNSAKASLPLYITGLIAHVVSKSGTFEYSSDMYIAILGFSCFVQLLIAIANKAYSDGKEVAQAQRAAQIAQANTAKYDNLGPVTFGSILR